MNNVVFQIFTLVFLGFYCITLHLFRMPGGENRQPRVRFVSLALVLCAMTFGLAAGKVLSGSFVSANPLWSDIGPGIGGGDLQGVGLSSGTRRLAGMPWLTEVRGLVGEEWFPVIIVFGVALAAAAVVVLQTGILRAAGALTFSGPVTGEIIEAKKDSLAILALVLAPPVVLFTGVNPIRDHVMVVLALGAMVAMAGVFVVRTSRLFLKQKIAFLIWFSYLCTIEILPLAAIFLVL